MDERDMQSCTAFRGDKRVASGNLAEVARKVKAIIDRGELEPVLIFGNFTSELIEVDFRGTIEDVLKKLTELEKRFEPEALPAPEPGAQRRPGRPRLGVVSREVTLLPRHWEWLGSQPGGASVALRKLVEEARRVNAGRDALRHAQEATYRFMSAMAGDLPGFEEAARALFAGDPGRFDRLVAEWPDDIRNHARELAAAVFKPVPQQPNSA